MEDLFRFADELGPFKIVHIYEPSVDLKAVLVVDNIARGPALGGIRMAPDLPYGVVRLSFTEIRECLKKIKSSS